MKYLELQYGEGIFNDIYVFSLTYMQILNNSSVITDITDIKSLKISGNMDNQYYTKLIINKKYEVNIFSPEKKFNDLKSAKDYIKEKKESKIYIITRYNRVTKFSIIGYYINDNFPSKKKFFTELNQLITAIKLFFLKDIFTPEEYEKLKIYNKKLPQISNNLYQISYDENYGFWHEYSNATDKKIFYVKQESDTFKKITTELDKAKVEYMIHRRKNEVTKYTGIERCKKILRENNINIS